MTDRKKVVRVDEGEGVSKTKRAEQEGGHV